MTEHPGSGPSGSVGAGSLETRPPVVVASVSVVVLALVFKAIQVVLALTFPLGPVVPLLQSPLIWPFFGRIRVSYVLVFVGQLVVFAAVAGLISWLGLRSLKARRGFWGALIVVWFATIVSGYLVGPVGAPFFYGREAVSQPGYLLSAAGGGGGWGLWTGWVAGLVTALVFVNGRRRPGDRSAATSYPGS